MPKISVIVPIYNVDSYLCQCIDSILAQTYTDFELLLVDDGSTDSSGVICDKYAEHDSRIHVFHKPNGGLSSARNYAIRKLKGEYVIFCDPDDYWTNINALYKMITSAQNNDCDIVKGDFCYVNEGGDGKWSNQCKKIESYANKVMSSGDFVECIIGGQWMVWQFLYKSSILQEFDKHIKFQEDIEFHIRLFSRSLRCMYIPLEFYAYRMRSNSIMHNISPNNLFQSFCLSYKFMNTSGKCSEVKASEMYKYYSVMMYYWNLCTLVKLYYPQRTQLICDFNLKQMQQKISIVAGLNILKYPIFIYIQPNLSCVLLRKYLQLKEFVRKLLKSSLN